MPAARRPLPRWGALALLVGAVLGLVTSLANHGEGPVAEHVGQLLDAPWTWVAVGLPGALVGRRWVASAALSAVTLAAAVLAYDLTDLHLGTYDTLPPDWSGPPFVDWRALIGDVAGYLAVAVVAAAGLATLVRLVRRGGVPGLLAQLVVPAYAAWGSWRRVSDAYASGSATDALVSVDRAVTVLAVLVVLALLLRGLLTPTGRVRATRLGG